MQEVEFSILYAIQELRCGFLDTFFVYLTKITGSHGEIWIFLSILFLLFKNTRKIGFASLLSYAFVYLLGQFVLKDLIARIRPCNIDTAVDMLVSRPGSYSCPSTHSAWAFACSVSFLLENKKIGIPAIILAVFIAFSRMYLFVHFPTDVLLGIALGILFAIGCTCLVKKCYRILEQRKTPAKE